MCRCVRHGARKGDAVIPRGENTASGVLEDLREKKSDAPPFLSVSSWLMFSKSKVFYWNHHYQPIKYQHKEVKFDSKSNIIQQKKCIQPIDLMVKIKTFLCRDYGKITTKQ